MKTLNKILFATILLAINSVAFAKPITKVVNGDYKIADRSISGFNSVIVGGPFDVIITQGEMESVKVEAPLDAMDKVITEVSFGVLNVYNKKDGRDWNNWWHDHKKIVVYVTVKELNSINISGSGSAIFKDGISAENLKLNISGTGDMVGNVDVKMLESVVSGSGDMKIAGKAENSKVSLKSSGDFAATKLITSNSEVNVTGSGDAQVNSTKVIDAKINGTGNVLYTGTVKRVYISQSGTGDIYRF